MPEGGTSVHGLVKWFDAARGFGFVTAEGVEGDILLHINVLRNFGQSSVADGSSISMRVQQTQRGQQAVEIIALTPPDVAANKDEIPDYMLPVPDGVPFEAARMKWYDKAKGFGFANVFGNPDDVFVHAEVLRRFGLADLQPGEAVCVRVVNGERGKLAAEVRKWEFFESHSAE